MAPARVFLGSCHCGGGIIMARLGGVEAMGLLIGGNSMCIHSSSCCCSIESVRAGIRQF